MAGDGEMDIDPITAMATNAKVEEEHHDSLSNFVAPSIKQPPPAIINTTAIVAPPPADEYEVSEESRLAQERQEKAVQDFLMKRRAQAMAVPTNDLSVCSRLRKLGEPVTLFGEREMERRDRLRSIMVNLEAEGQLERILKEVDGISESVPGVGKDVGDDGEEEFGAPLTYPFYTEGAKELLDARVEIAMYSIERAKDRLSRARRRRDDPDEDPETETEYAVKQAAAIELQCSEMGDGRPLSGCSFSHDGSMLATRYVQCWQQGILIASDG